MTHLIQDKLNIINKMGNVQWERVHNYDSVKEKSAEISVPGVVRITY
jgi:hypothetical protein